MSSPGHHPGRPGELTNLRSPRNPGAIVYSFTKNRFAHIFSVFSHVYYFSFQALIKYLKNFIVMFVQIFVST